MSAPEEDEVVRKGLESAEKIRLHLERAAKALGMQSLVVQAVCDAIEEDRQGVEAAWRHRGVDPESVQALCQLCGMMDGWTQESLIGLSMGLSIGYHIAAIQREKW